MATYLDTIFNSLCIIYNLLLKRSFGSMSGSTSIPNDNVGTLFTTSPSIIESGLNLDTDISAAVSNQKRVFPKHLTKV